MKHIEVTKQFAYRLRDALIAAGYISNRSTSGVDIHKLSKITGHSTQICRKYLRGEAMPEPAKLIHIAAKLQVSPGWLLFGEKHHDDPTEPDKIKISKNLLYYIFKQADSLYNAQLSSQEVTDFLFELANDVSQLNADEVQSKKIIDIALGSVKHFSHGSN